VRPPSIQLGRTRWLLAALLLLTALTVAVGQPAGGARAAAPAPPRASPAAGQNLLDLAAMTLIPSDMPQGQYVLDTNGMVSLAEEAASANFYRHGSDADLQHLTDELRGAGWLRRYTSRLGLPTANDPTQFTLSVVSYVTEYRDAAGAAKGFAILQDESLIPTARTVQGTRTFGDRSQLTSDSGTTSDGAPFRELALAFQLGNLTAGVIVDDYTNHAPAVATVEALGAKLQARIATVRARPEGLGSEILRLAAPGPSSALDGYIRRDGITIPLYNEPGTAFSARNASYDGASDVYDYQQTLPRNVATGVPMPYYLDRLWRFPSASAASTWLRTAVQAVGVEGGPYVELTQVPRAAKYGDESLTYSYGYRISDTLTTQGFMIFARVGNEVARVQIDGAPSVPLSAVAAVAAEQVACLRARVCPSAAPLPPGLPGAATATPGAATSGR